MAAVPIYIQSVADLMERYANGQRDFALPYAIDLSMAQYTDKIRTLRGADLRGADFSHGSLRHVDLRDTDIRGATFYAVDLEGADFRGATAGVDGEDLFRNHLFQGTSFMNADMQGADLREVTWTYPRRWGFPQYGVAFMRASNQRGRDFEGAARLRGVKVDAAAMEVLRRPLEWLMRTGRDVSIALEN